MTECSCEAAVTELGESTLTEFDREVPGVAADLCAPFNVAASRLEGQLLTIYRTVVQSVRCEEDMDKIARCWGAMVKQCDEFAKRLHDLSVSHPGCGANLFSDRVLDLRNRCQRLQEMHS